MEVISRLKSYSATDWTRLYLTVVCFSFITFSVTFKDSYNIFSALLLLSYLSFFSRDLRQKIHLSKVEKSLILVICAYFASYLIEFFLFYSEPRLLDKPAKALLLVPLILLLNAIKIDYRYLLTAFILSSALLFLQAGYEKWVHNVLRAGSSINSIQYGSIAVAIASAALALTGTITRNSNRHKLFGMFLLLIAGTGLIAVVFTGSRGSIIAIPVILILIFALYIPAGKLTKAKLSLGIILFTLLAAFFINNAPLKARFQTSIDNSLAFFEDNRVNTSTGVRLGSWLLALEAGLQSPFLGVGYPKLVEYKQQQVETGRFDKFLLTFKNSHSTYFEAFARRGLVGLSAVIVFLGFPIYCGLAAWRRRGCQVAPYAVALTAFGSAFFIANLTQEVIFLNTGIIMYTGLLVILTGLLAERTQALEEQADST